MYNFHDELKLYTSFKLPLKVVTRRGARLYNHLADLSVKALKLPDDIKMKTYQVDAFKVVVYSPADLVKRPALVYFHGGGFVLKGSSKSHEMMWYYARELECHLVYVDYRVAPDHQHPLPVMDCAHAIRWVYDNMDMLGVDSRILVAGESAGGALATCALQVLTDQGFDYVKYQMLIYPVTDNRMISESMKAFDDVPVWHAKHCEKMWPLYLGDADTLYGSPMAHKDLSRLPPAYIEVAEYDALRDEGLMYAEKLASSGVDVEVNYVKGAFHGYDMFKKNMVKEQIHKRIKALKAAMTSCDESS